MVLILGIPHKSEQRIEQMRHLLHVDGPEPRHQGLSYKKQSANSTSGGGFFVLESRRVCCQGDD